MLVGLVLSSCGQQPGGAPVAAVDPHFATHGPVEVTGTLIEVPEGAIFDRDLYDRMALEVPIDDHFMGGIVNKYFGKETGPLYRAVWTNPE